MSTIDILLPTPRRIEINTVELEAPQHAIWEHLRHGDLAEAPLVRALFGLRTLVSRWGAPPPSPQAFLRLDDLRSTKERPGFALLAEEPPQSLTVGAIGKVWQVAIPFFHVDGPGAFLEMSEPGWIKVAWEIRLEPWGPEATRLTFELRVDATDDDSWKKFETYWRLIGPGSHFVRHLMLSRLRRHFGALGSQEEARAMPGDELLVDALEQLTHGVTIRASPQSIWPWLVQMGCTRAGFYSLDRLDNGGTPSAREIHPELQELRVGQIVPAAPGQDEGFEVLAIEENRARVLGGLFDNQAGKQLPFHADRPGSYWHVTWAFSLEALDENTTRLHVRARASFAPSLRWHALWIRPVHALMETSQLKNLAARAEGRLPRDTLGDVAEGTVGAAIMLLALATPFLRSVRNHWGLTQAEAQRSRPGDDLVAEPRWSWTHALEIDATPERIWPWIAQLGADRAGFYSYQWLENLAGCNLRNAEALQPKWAHEEGTSLLLHPEIPALRVVACEPPRSLVAFSGPNAEAKAQGDPWVTASWAFLIEPVGPERSRLVSRFRTACSSDLATRLAQGPLMLEPIGFAMDRRMLLGIAERVIATQARQEHQLKQW